MRKLKDLTGQKFGRLTVLQKVEKDKYNNSQYLCKCECGNIIKTKRSYLVSGDTHSCGCLQKELITNRNTKHGLSKLRLYKIFQYMKQRCYNPKKKEYKNYGGRGIQICTEWLKDFMTFYKWSLDNGYTDNLSIDRIKVNGNYEPSNCRWVTMKEQSNNKRPISKERDSKGRFVKNEVKL